MHDWRDNGNTNHLLINRVTNYKPSELTSYFLIYISEYRFRYRKSVSQEIIDEFWNFGNKGELTPDPFKYWHNENYLRVCMANLYEKYHFGLGKSRVTIEEWKRLLEGYKEITKKDYQI
jgi:hypothetical protein